MAFCLGDSARVIPSLSLCPLSRADRRLKHAQESRKRCKSFRAVDTVTVVPASCGCTPECHPTLSELGFPPKDLLNYRPSLAGLCSKGPYRHIHLAWRPPETLVTHGQLLGCPCELIRIQPFSVGSEAQPTLSRCGLHAPQAGSRWLCGVWPFSMKASSPKQL